MTELEFLSERLEAAAKRQMEADEAYHKAAEEVESIKAAMVELKNRKKKECTEKELFAACKETKAELKELCDLAYGENRAGISIHLYIPAGSGQYQHSTDYQFVF